MARLDDFLARWLMRRLKRDPVDGAVSALAEHAEQKRIQIERLSETAGKRSQIHQELKKRHRQLKREFKAMKEQARTNQHESWKWETECRVLRERMKAYEHALAGKLEQPGVASPPLQNDARAWNTFLNIRGKVWKYPMRLGVLRQHEPKPMQRERFPRSKPPGAEETW